MNVTTRIVLDVSPDVKTKLKELIHVESTTQKDIISKLIEEEYRRKVIK